MPKKSRFIRSFRDIASHLRLSLLIFVCLLLLLLDAELLLYKGVVLHSPILSGMRVLTESRALSCLDIYPNVDRASRLSCPVMVMHGMKDEEVGQCLLQSSALICHSHS